MRKKIGSIAMICAALVLAFSGARAKAAPPSQPPGQSNGGNNYQPQVFDDGH